MGDIGAKVFNSRKRGLSHDNDLVIQKRIIQSGMHSPREQWTNIKFENEDDRMAKFIEYLHKN